MSTQKFGWIQNALNAKRTLGVALTAAAALAAIPALALADDPYTMAPPVDQASANYSNYGNDGNGNGVNNAPESSSASSSVFSWQEIPANQRVPIQRAVFDQGGYQLYDTAGETIVVPFANNNLYVMKFAVSPDGSTYFINDGSYPILFLPRNAYLDNASVNGARWYPFSDNFHPEHPVFLGIAPSWNDYCGMGWYPNMFYYGGYYGDTAFGLFTPSFGLFINIGGHPYYGWDSYNVYLGYHPDYYRVRYYHPYVYAYAGHQYWGGRTFQGYGGGGRPYGGYGHDYGRGYGYAGNYGHGGYGNNFGGGRVFNGAGRPFDTQTRSFSDGRNSEFNHGSGGDRGFTGTGDRGFAGDHGFNGGGRPDTGGPANRDFHINASPSARTFRGAGGSYNVPGAGRFEGTGGSGGTRIFGNDHSYSGEGRTYGNTGSGGFQGATRTYGSNGGGFQGATRTYGNGGSYGHAYSGNGESAPRSFNGGGGNNGGGFRGANVNGGGGGGNSGGGFHGASAGGGNNGGGFHGGDGSGRR